MSWPAVQWAMKAGTERRLKPVQALILIRLAARLNFLRGGGAWPSHATMAEEIGKSVDTVQRALDELEALGLIRRERRKGDEGKNRTNLYFLACQPEFHEGDMPHGCGLHMPHVCGTDQAASQAASLAAPMRQEYGKMGIREDGNLEERKNPLSFPKSKSVTQQPSESSAPSVEDLRREEEERERQDQARAEARSKGKIVSAHWEGWTHDRPELVERVVKAGISLSQAKDYLRSAASAFQLAAQWSADVQSALPDDRDGAVVAEAARAAGILGIGEVIPFPKKGAA